MSFYWTLKYCISYSIQTLEVCDNEYVQALLLFSFRNKQPFFEQITDDDQVKSKKMFYQNFNFDSIFFKNFTILTSYNIN